MERGQPVHVLAVAAHPDDVEQTCGGVLLCMAERGYRTAILDLMAGEMGSRGTPAQRAAEAAEAARILWIGERRNAGLPDTRLENSLAARLRVAAIVRGLRPRVEVSERIGTAARTYGARPEAVLPPSGAASAGTTREPFVNRRPHSQDRSEL